MRPSPALDRLLRYTNDHIYDAIDDVLPEVERLLIEWTLEHADPDGSEELTSAEDALAAAVALLIADRNRSLLPPEIFTWEGSQ